MSETMHDNQKLPKRRPLVLTYEEMSALSQLIDSRLEILDEFLHPRMKTGLKIRAKRLRSIRKKLQHI